MIQALHDPFWQFIVGSIIGLMGIVIALIGLMHQLKKTSVKPQKIQSLPQQSQSKYSYTAPSANKTAERKEHFSDMEYMDRKIQVYLANFCAIGTLLLSYLWSTKITIMFLGINITPMLITFLIILHFIFFGTRHMHQDSLFLSVSWLLFKIGIALVIASTTFINVVIFLTPLIGRKDNFSQIISVLSIILDLVFICYFIFILFMAYDDEASL